MNKYAPVYRLILSIVFLLSLNSPGMATAPQSMVLKYDTAAGRLAVEVYHHTDERYEHYINTYLVSVNGGPDQRFFQQGQTSSAVTLKDMRVVAHPGDTLVVTAICTHEDRLNGELILTDQFREGTTGSYTAIVKKPDRHQDRLRKKADRFHGYPYRIHGSHKGSPSGPPPEDERPAANPANPVIEGNRAQQHRQEVEQEINRRAYEAKFGPLLTPDDEAEGSKTGR
ncbi:MAG: hypothetical protein KC897_10935 [Candidatus Omnitrophica bacterium]|nr:hypothetical protein [Candidatus Omnitrophota bacterium]MCB9721694.1 hypothetical protein [Candidatus Omnitrophota bacterium]